MKFYRLFYSVNGQHTKWFHNIAQGFWFWTGPETAKNTLLDRVKKEYGDGFQIETVQFIRIGFWRGVFL